jgi:hypothetical protein
LKYLFKYTKFIVENGFLALIEAASHAFLRGYSVEQEIAPEK